MLTMQELMAKSMALPDAPGVSVIPTSTCKALEIVENEHSEPDPKDGI